MPSDTAAAAEPAAGTSAALIASWAARRPPVIRGRYGVTDTSPYDTAYFDRLSARPPISGAVDQRYADTYSYLLLAGPEQLASVSRLIVRGRPVALSRPYFNSHDGSYWDASFVGPDAGRAVASQILRDVLFEVDEVIGDASDVESLPGLMEFTVRGGQALVTITESKVGSESDHPLPPGTYLIGYHPEVDLVVGEEVIIFLDYFRLDGLYVDEGTRFGYIYRLMPAHDLYYKWTLDGNTASNESFDSTLDVSQLRELVASEHFASAVGPSPDDKVHEQPPLHEH
ncbi:MAG: hypothetical protein H0V12_03935 [Chloroflexi bacterium]|nr:hypothetical protein [Chloroflexota bacterium]